MKISKKITYFLLHLSVVMVIPVGYFLLSKKDKYFKNEESVYKLDLVYIKTRLNGIVTKSSMSEVYAGKQLVELSTNEKFYISIPSINWAYSRRHRILVVDRQDHIYKPANTDSIFIIKPNGEKYFFIAGEVINKRVDFQISK